LIQFRTNFEQEVQRFLDEQHVIDSVLIWAPGDRRRGGWRRLFPRFRQIDAKRAILHQVLKERDNEDHSRVCAAMFPRSLAEIIEDELGPT
jgi:hypothetical protein